MVTRQRSCATGAASATARCSASSIAEHNTAWSRLEDAFDAYLDALIYDLEVLRRYLVNRVKDDTLVIVVGDHQPPGGVTGSSTGHGVPLHVLSRRQSLVEPFLARGYASGMRPGAPAPVRASRPSCFSFLRDFSEDLRQTRAVGGHSPGATQSTSFKEQALGAPAFDETTAWALLRALSRRAALGQPLTRPAGLALDAEDNLVDCRSAGVW